MLALNAMFSSFGTITRTLQAFSLFWLMLAFVGSVVQVLPHLEVAKVMGCYCIHVRGLLVAFLLCCDMITFVVRMIFMETCHWTTPIFVADLY